MGINLPDRVWLRDDGNDSVELTGPTDGTQYVKLSSILPRVTQDEWDKLDALAMEVERLAERDKEVRRKLGMEDSEEGVEMTESEYITATNLAKMRTAITILRDILPGPDWGITELELLEIIRPARKSEEKLANCVELK